MAENVADEYASDRLVWRFVLKGALVGLAVGIVLALFGSDVGLSQSRVLLGATPILVAVIIQLVRVGVVDTRPMPPAPTPDVTVPEYFGRLRQLERRLEGSVRSSEDFEWSVRPMLVDLINGRLLNEHGINYRTDPARARTIVGDQLWEIMISPADRPERSMNQRALTALIGQLEQL